MTDTEKSQLRQDLMEQFRQMMAEDLPTGQQYPVGDVEAQDWASTY